MLVSTALALAGTASFAVAHPFRPTTARRAVTSFPAGTSFDIILNKASTNAKEISSNNAFSVIDIDLFDNDANTIADYKAAGKKVICYFSAGTREDWRDDKTSFQSSDYGKAMEDWPGENWVSVKSDNVKAIMKKRIALAKEKGCDAIDPDNTDGFSSNQDGWGFQKADYAAYIKFLAQEAAAVDLSIGLKNSLDLIPDVIDVVQFAVNEQCHEYEECDAYKPFTAADKAVFNIEYGGQKCDSPADVKLTILNKPADQGLNTLGGQCAVSGGEPAAAPSSSQAPVSSAKPSATDGATKPSVTAAPSATQTGAPPEPTPTTPSEDDNEEDGDGEEEGEEEKSRPKKGQSWAWWKNN
ncbi:unnamed protein product [Periconia digitata]|uniref:alpha-galactosidase n=1 Tax=Periconia digitata TaxID=1303443 RepID=A0A9W4UGP2_9PLEO|nr:unnamed protein product [Periconia digitata]